MAASSGVPLSELSMSSFHLVRGNRKRFLQWPSRMCPANLYAQTAAATSAHLHRFENRKGITVGEESDGSKIGSKIFERRRSRLRGRASVAKGFPVINRGAGTRTRVLAPLIQPPVDERLDYRALWRNIVSRRRYCQADKKLRSILNTITLNYALNINTLISILFVFALLNKFERSNITV